jgi:hypothetical protein
MADDRIWTAAELEALSPNERDEVVKSGFVTDLSQVSPDLLDRARRKVDRWVAATEGTQASQ